MIDAKVVLQVFLVVVASLCDKKKHVAAFKPPSNDGRPYHYVSDVRVHENLTLSEEENQPISVSHFTTIGMTQLGDSREDYYKATSAIFADEANLKRLSVPGLMDCHYVIYSSRSGAQLWGTLHEGTRFGGFVPHFQGKSKVQLCILSLKPTFPRETAPDECEACGEQLDGCLMGVHDECGNAVNFLQADDKDQIEMMKMVAQTKDGVVSSGFGFANPDTREFFFSFDFDCPNYGFCGQIRPLPKTATVQLSLFAREVSTYPSVKDYEELEINSNYSMASQFFGSGSFAEDNLDVSKNNAYALIVGHVVEAELRTNELTGEPFYWALVRTAGDMEIDVVIHPTLLKTCVVDPPKVGGVVRCYGWLSGLLLERHFIINKLQP